MRSLTIIGVLAMLSTGCNGGVASGLLLMPAGLTINDDVSCADITVSIFANSDFSSGIVADAQAQGDISTGSCRYSLTLPSGTTAFAYFVMASVRDIQYEECGGQAVATDFNDVGLGMFFTSFGASVNLQATASCQ